MHITLLVHDGINGEKGGKIVGWDIDGTPPNSSKELIL